MNDPLHHAHHDHSHDHSHPHGHAHAHDHEHPHRHETASTSHHVETAKTLPRRDFLRVLMGGALAGASVMELAYHRAAWARAAAPGAHADLFDIHQAAPGVYFAHALPQAVINCNAAIFVRSKDVVIVDAHSKPSAAASLIRQIKRDITDKPVRYVVNTHFHWDHTQGNQAYTKTGDKVDFIATAATQQLMSDFAVVRMKASVDAIPEQIEALRAEAAKSKSAQEKSFCADQIRQMQAYVADLKDYSLELPTITFDKSYTLQDPAFDLNLEFHGQAHTAGDLFVFCPQQRAVATGDASHGWLPFIGDGFPHHWPGTIDEVARADFKHILGGHGPLQSDRSVMMNQRNYIEDLTGRVEEGRNAGQSVAEMQKRITVGSLHSLQANEYIDFLAKTLPESHLRFGPQPPLQDEVNVNIADIYKNLDRT